MLALVLLYPIVDVDACASKGVEPVQLAKWLSAAGVTMLQIRAKDWDTGRILALVHTMQRVVPAQACRIVLNDRVDVAKGAHCYGVHVGQGDMPVQAVRSAAPGLAVGVSTHSLEQVNAALESAPDYLAFGPVFATTSKRNPEPAVGVEYLRQAHALARHKRVPLVAIGGITEHNVDSVRAHCDYVAVIGAITHADERRVTQAVRAIERE
jgi:thiamine-phosphate pyrophosphorylase